MEKTHGNLKVSGSGTYAGGLFERVIISGSAKVTDAIECTQIKCSGAATFKGDVTSETMQVAGSVKVKGQMVVDKLSIAGSSKIEGTVQAKQLKVAGHATFEQKVNSDKIEIYGHVQSKGSIEAEEVTVKGCLVNEHTINAEHIYINAKEGAGHFNEIGASTVCIRREEAAYKWFSFFRWGNRKGTISGELIEADTITIEYAKVKVLRGHDVTIGKGCQVDKVEYTGTLTIDEEAIVKESEYRAS